MIAFAALVAPRWTHDADLSHGLLAPLLSALLIHESRTRGFPRYVAHMPGWRGLTAGLLLAGLAVVALGGLFAGALDWAHPLVASVFGVALAALLAGLLLHLASTSTRLVPLNWASVVAILIWPLSAPLPPGTATRMSLELQLLVTDIVLRLLHVLGVPAERSGNLIHLAHTTLGVEEACSGMRSLVSCIVAALFFSATFVRRPLSRAALLLAAAPLAFAMNILRSLVLTLLAHHGIDISGTWHDITGFAVLGATAAALFALALSLARAEGPRQSPSTPAAPTTGASHTPAPPRRGAWGVPAALVSALVLAFAFVRGSQPASPKASMAVPDLNALLPTAAPGWQTVTTQDLYRFAATLQTDHLVQRTYRRATPTGPLDLTVYLAYWSPGQAAVSLVATHTPEACWPGTGWVLQTRATAPEPLVLGGRTLVPPAYCRFANEGYPQHVWYWHLHERRSITRGEPLSPRELLRLSLRYGFRTTGEQAFVRISSNRPVAEWRDDPLLVEIVDRLRTLGL